MKWAVAWLLVSSTALAQSLEVAFLDVGQGDATLVTSPTGKRVLIDGGPTESAHALVEAVRRHGRQPLDLVMLTHRHADHLGGLSRIISTVGARQFLDAPSAHQSPLYARLISVLQERGIPVRDAVYARTIEIGGGARLELLGPPSPRLRSRSDENANGIVARLDWRRASVLLAADAESSTEKWLLARQAPLAARVLKVAHHGSAHSSTAKFLRAVAPEIAIVSCGANNEYHHPAPATLARLEATGARVYRTDRDGEIRLRSDGESLKLSTARRPTLRIAHQ